MFAKQQQKKLLFVFILVSFLFLTGCGVQESGNWPGLETDGERVYVAYQDSVVALDPTGPENRVVWSYSSETAGVNFYAPPSIKDGNLVVGDNGISAGIFQGGGFIVGIHSMPLGDTNPPTTNWIADDVVSGRVYAEALQVDGKIFFGTADNHFVALDATDGTKIWDFMTGNSVWAQPSYANGHVYFTSLDKTIYSADADTGEIIWQAALSGASTGTPVINEEANLLYIGSFEGILYAFDLTTGEEKWTAQTDDWVWSTPALHNNTVYFGDMAGNIIAIEAEDRTDETPPIWQEQVPESIQAKLLIHNDTLFVASGDVSNNVGHLTAYKLDGSDDGQPVQLWQATTNGAISANPVATSSGIAVAFADADGVLQVVVYDMESGNDVWSYTPSTE